MKNACLLILFFFLFTAACAEDETAPKAPALYLTSLTVSSGALTPAFNPAVTAYTVSVSNTVDVITVTGTAADTNTIVSYEPLQSIALTLGSNLLTVRVTSKDLSMSRNYRIVVCRLRSDNAALSSLTLNTGTLSPTFNAAVTNYTVNVGSTVSTLTLTSVAVESNAVVSYDPVQPVTLSIGSNFVRIRVISHSTLVTNTYQLVAFRDAGLATLSVSAGKLVPPFSATTYRYALNVTNGVTALTFTPTVEDATAQISFTPSATLSLNIGSNFAKIAVTAEDGTRTREYQVIIRRNGPTPSDLTSPTVSGITLKGVPSGAFQKNGTANTFYTPAFRISRTEITRAQFNTVMGSDPSQTAYSSGTSDPVQNVNWYHAIAFCNKLSIRDGLSQVYSVSGVNFNTLTFASIPITNNTAWGYASINTSATGYRLPSSGEWVWAAMGAQDSCSKPFAGSTGVNFIGDYAWYSVNSGGKTHPSGSKLPNELGLFDMSGNVGEWCSDYCGGDWRFYYGGSWYQDASQCIINREFDYGLFHEGFVTSISYRIGFRVVRP